MTEYESMIKYADVHVNGIPANKCILDKSVYFRSLFDFNKSKDKITISLDNDILKIIILHIYNAHDISEGYNWDSFESDILIRLIPAANEFLLPIDGLIEQLCKNAKTFSELFDIYTYAKTNKVYALKLTKFKSLKAPEIKQLLELDEQTVINIFSSNDDFLYKYHKNVNPEIIKKVIMETTKSHIIINNDDKSKNSAYFYIEDLRKHKKILFQYFKYNEFKVMMDVANLYPFVLNNKIIIQMPIANEMEYTKTKGYLSIKSPNCIIHKDLEIYYYNSSIQNFEKYKITKIMKNNQEIDYSLNACDIYFEGDQTAKSVIKYRAGSVYDSFFGIDVSEYYGHVNNSRTID